MDNEGTDFDGKFIDDTGPNTREMTYHSKIEESLQPVALLMDELKSDETQSRVEAMRRLETISLALGAERSRTELLPFLLSCCLDEEDEILYVLAEETVKLAGDLLGGFQYTALLIPLLEELCGAEELTVRTKAIESFKSLFSINLNLEIIHGSNLKELLTAAVGTISRLAIGDWHSKRTSAAQLLSFVCGVYSSPIEIDRSEILDNFNIDTFVQEILVPLISDDTVLVRKAAVISLGEVAKYCSLSFVETKLLELLGRLASDPQDSVRLHAVESLGSFVALLKERDETRIRGLLPLFSSLVMDESWRIRFMAASTYASFSALSRDIDYLSIYISLLADPEAEVRCAAAKSLAAVASSIDAARENVITLLESVRSLSIDSSPHVRSAVALQLNELSLALGSTLATEEILPLILQLLKDESSEVRLNVVSRLDVIVSVVGIEHLSAALLPAVVALTEDPQWRVRQTIIDYIPDLASHLGQAFFADRLAPLALSALGDAVFEVRKSSVSAVRRLIGIFGIDWTINSLLPVILDPLAGNRNYLRRQTALLLISETASVLDVSTLQSVYGPILETLSKDPVPNVRLSVAKCLREVVPLVSASDSSDFFLQGSVVPMLQALDRDSDTDVHHEAFLALRLVPS